MWLKLLPVSLTAQQVYFLAHGGVVQGKSNLRMKTSAHMVNDTRCRLSVRVLTELMWEDHLHALTHIKVLRAEEGGRAQADGMGA